MLPKDNQNIMAQPKPGWTTGEAGMERWQGVSDADHECWGDAIDAETLRRVTLECFVISATFAIAACGT